MKRVLKFIFCIVLWSFTVGCTRGYAQTNPNAKKSVDAMNLKGAVKSIKLRSYEAQENTGNITKGKRATSGEYDTYWLFNEQGNLKEKRSYSSNGSLFRTITCRYNDEGKLAEQNISTEEDPDEKWVYIYGPEGILRGVKITDAGKLYEKWTYENENGRLKETQMYGSNEHLKRVFKYQYDDNGNTIEEGDYSRKGELFRKWMYAYDEENHKTEENYHASDDGPIFKKSFGYNQQGDVTAKKTYNADGSIDEEWRFEYKYDSKHNWIQKIGFKSEAPAGIIEREITYF